MPQAARLLDTTSHASPLNPGPGSPDVRIGHMSSWRALPAGMGAGIENAMDTMSQLMNAPFLNPVTTPNMLAQVFTGLMQDAGKAATKGAPGAPGTTLGEFNSLIATNAQQTATYTAAAAVPGGQPAAIAAYTLAMKQAAAQFAAAALSAIAGLTDMHMCPMPSGPAPHGPGVVTKGSKSVFINGLPACRMGDKVFEAAGGSDAIAIGCLNVNIGDMGGGPGASGSAAGHASADADATSAMAADVIESYASGAAGGIAGSPSTSRPTDPRSSETVRKTKHFVAFRIVIDLTGEPLAGVALQITLPEGRTESRTTDADGRVEFKDLNTPGVCTVTCPMKNARLATTFDFVMVGETRSDPQPDLYDAVPPVRPKRSGGIIAEIEQRGVQTGETLESIAGEAGMTWQQLALFNWSTSNPDEINHHLRDDVGCRKKTPDRKNYVFDSEDDPGVIFVPRPWEQSGLVTDQSHTFRVQTFAFVPRERRIRLFDGFAQPIPRGLYAVEVAGAEVARGRADENGDFIVPAAVTRVCTVKWGGPVDAHLAPAPFEENPAAAEPLIFARELEFEYVRDIFVDLDQPAPGATGTAQAADQKRLSNMGYSAGKTLAENVMAFQRDTQQALTGVLEHVSELVCEQHDDRCHPPQGVCGTHDSAG